MRAAATPRFSVIVPAFNAAATIAAAIDSVLAQTRQDFEVIVVDDGSLDATADVVERTPDDRVTLLSQANHGLPAARNAGVSVARGDLVAFLDSDDLWLPRYLESAATAFEATPGAGLAWTDAYAFDPVTRRVGRRLMDGVRPPRNPPADSAAFLLELLRRNFIFVSGTVPRHVFDEVGGFDITLDSAEDYCLWLQIVARGYRAAWMPGKHALYRIHPAQMSGNPVRLRTGELMALRTLDVPAMPSDAHRDLLFARQRQLEQMISLYSGQSKPSARRFVRSWIGRLRRRAGYDPYHWQERPPAEVSEAFPNLARV